MLDIAERTRTDPDEVVDSASFIDDLGADSLDMVELALKFEREFGFEISDDAAESILTVGDAVKFLERNALT
jgi:acyl carrier protein